MGLIKPKNEIIYAGKSEHKKRIMIGIPTTGLVRYEWVMARYGQVVPCNWSQVEMSYAYSAWSPIGFQVAEARNIIATRAVEEGFEWLCFTGRTEVEMKKGAKRISEICVGDVVKTHTGEYHKVVNILKRHYPCRSSLVEINTNNSSIKCTPEHPFLAYRPFDSRMQGVEWVTAESLNTSDKLLYPNTDKQDWLEIDCLVNITGKDGLARTGCANGVKIDRLLVDDDLAYFMGLYLAEGCAERDAICFTVNNNETHLVEIINRVIKNSFNRKPTIRVRWATHVKLNIRTLAKKFKQWFGSHATNKEVPDFVFEWSLRNRLQFLKGYLDGDGSTKSTSGCAFNTASKQLMHDILYLCYEAGLNVSSNGATEPKSTTMKDGHIINNHGSYWAYMSAPSYQKLLDLIESSMVELDGVLYNALPIKNISPKGMAASLVDQNVYNLEVEGDNSYIVSGCAVHNCFIDHDTCPPPTMLISMNEYMLKGTAPVVSGLYFTKSVPADPLVYREFGTGSYRNWKMGDKLWVKGCGMGCTLIHCDIFRAMKKDVPIKRIKTMTGADAVVSEYFVTPAECRQNELGQWMSLSGTEDLYWCKLVAEGDYITKAGWPKVGKKEHQFLIDTNIFCRHISNDGVMYPSRGEENEFLRKK